MTKVFSINTPKLSHPEFELHGMPFHLVTPCGMLTSSRAMRETTPSANLTASTGVLRCRPLKIEDLEYKVQMVQLGIGERVSKGGTEQQHSNP